MSAVSLNASRLMILVALANPMVQGVARAGEECLVSEVAIDTSVIKTSGHVLPSKALGQSFVATTTTVRAFTAWQPASTVPHDPILRIIVTSIDGTGRPVTPPLFDGTERQFIHAEGGAATELRWDLDPPLELPGPGTYIVFVQVPFYGVSITVGDEYPSGHLWSTYRSDLNYDYLKYAGAIVERDMVFSVEFCNETTPVRQSTWGRVKSIYR